ncbi:TPA: undecaprenyl-diphosphate phosphatase [Candidatus Avacholeplasma faecigallinarum]|nr:undecaprenyl-diphosphate phosphatase [Candidatus Avacholeplasma faecigallinarum]
MEFIEVLKAILFGIVEGITEWLPISSTGHMIILEELLDVQNTYGSAFWNLFLVVIQLGAIIAVVVCFFNKLNPFFGKSLIVEGEEKTKEEKKNIWILWAKVIVGCIPAAVIGLFLDDIVNKYLNTAVVVSITLILYGILFIVLEIFNKKREFKTYETMNLTWKTAFFIGCFQILALIPGTSRSGVTILGAMLLLCSRSVASEFSFFLSIPVMFGASLLKLVKFFIDGNSLVTSQVLFLLIGCVVAFMVSLFVIKFLMSFIKKHDFKPFGVYRIILGVLLLVLFLCNVL